MSFLELGYSVRPIGAYFPLKTFRLLDFPIFWWWAYPMNVVQTRVVRTKLDIYIFIDNIQKGRLNQLTNHRYPFENTGEAIKNRQSRATGNILYTRWRQEKHIHNTICVEHHNAQATTIRDEPSYKTIGDKDEQNIVFYADVAPDITTRNSAHKAT